MAQFKTVALTMAILLSGGGAWAEEVPGPETTNAYKTFWESFDAYERELINEGESKYQQSWKSIKDIKEKHAYEFTLKQIENLDDAAYEYQQHLKKHPQAHNRPYVYLNLAQILSKIADLKESMGEDGSSYTQEALAVLDELEKSVPEFEKREATLYLKGLLLSKLGADKTASATGKNCQSSPRIPSTVSMLRSRSVTISSKQKNPSNPSAPTKVP